MLSQGSVDRRKSVDAADQIVDEAWIELRRRYYVQSQLGLKPWKLPDLSFDEAVRRSRVGEALLGRIMAVELDALPHNLAVTLRVAAFKAQCWAKEAQWYWSVIDPFGTGLFGMFLPTPYCGGWLLNHIHGQLSSFLFESIEDTERYLVLVKDYGRLIEQFATRTSGQAERGMRMPKVQARQARKLLEDLKAKVGGALGVSPERLANVNAPQFTRQVGAAIRDVVEPRFDAALSGLSDSYLRLAPHAVGLGQYPAGPQVYQELVKFHTTLGLTPDEVHSRGQDRMKVIQIEMHAIREQLGFTGGNVGLLEMLSRDKHWRASDVEEIRRFFSRYIERLKPRLKECFRAMPEATFGVEPLPSELQAGMTFGYYQPPRIGNERGQYLFNANHLAKQPLHGLGTLTYHELMPGHHLQFSLHHENSDLHPVCRHSAITAYVEGWAEYAATLAGELGCYVAPEERYGRLAMEAFFTCRLVVDTGMNAFGWSLQRAKDYMREHAAITEAEIASEALRYSCDIPAQGLAYKIGDVEIMKLRDHMAHSLGTRFDIKEFHHAILAPGVVPLPDLEWHLAFVIDELQSRQVITTPGST